MILKYVLSIMYSFLDHVVGSEFLIGVGIEMMVVRDVTRSCLVPVFKTTHSHMAEDHHHWLINFKISFKTYSNGKSSLCDISIMSNCYVQLSHHGGHESHIAVATRNMFHVCLTDKSAKRVSLFSMYIEFLNWDWNNTIDWAAVVCTKTVQKQRQGFYSSSKQTWGSLSLVVQCILPFLLLEVKSSKASG